VLARRHHVKSEPHPSRDDVHANERIGRMSVSPDARQASSEDRTSRAVSVSGEIDAARAGFFSVQTLGRVAVAIIGGVVGLWAICSLWWPYGWDHGCFSFVADTILHGGVPYRDAWDFKGPLTFFVFTLLQAIFGTQMWAIRLLDLLLLAAAAFSAAKIVSLFAGRIAAACTALMLVLTFASFGNWYTGQPDGWAANLLVIAVALLLTAEPVPASRLAMVGFLIGANSLLKPLYGTYLLLVLCAVWPEDQSKIAHAIRRLAVALAGFGAPIAITLGWFAARGALGDLYDVHVRFNFERMSTDPYLRMSLSRALRSSLGILTILPNFACVLAPAAVGAGVLWRERRRTGVMFLVWLALSLFLVAAQRKFSVQNYSWHPICAPLVLLGSIGLIRLWRIGSTGDNARPVRWLVVVLVAVLFKLTAKDPGEQIGRWASYVAGRMTPSQYRATFDVNIAGLGGASANTVGFSIARDVELADYLREHTRPDDEVLVWSDPLVNYLSSRPAITPITIAHAFTTWGSEARRQRYRSELLAKMASERAIYFGVPLKDLEQGTDETNLPAHFPELVSVLATSYEQVGEVGDVALFKHKIP
jgi:hypothetical protein